MFDEGFEFPWDADEFDGDIEEWWKHVNGYDNPHYCPFTEAGEYKDDAPVTVDQFGQKSVKHDDPRVSAYYEYRRKWMSSNPVPIEVVNYCSGDCPMYVLAVKHIECSRGYPQEIDPALLEVTDDDKQRLRDFLERFDIEADEPKWWLTSYWG